MPNRIITNDLKIEIAKDFTENFSANTNLHYVFAAKSLPNELDDFQIVPPRQSVTEGFYKIFESMIFAKKINQSDVSLMIKNNLWISGTSYDMYDDLEPNLEEKKFFVISEEPGDIFSVFKCLYNGRVLNEDGSYTVPPSISQPLSTETSPSDEFYRTADGYVWKLMGTMSRSHFSKFSTNEFAPLPTRISEVQTSAVNGSIEFIEVINGGANYNAFAFGTIKTSQVAGNTRIFSLQTDETLDIITFEIDNNVGTFVETQAANVPKRVFFRRTNGTIWSVSGNVYNIISQSIIRFLLNSSVNLPTNIVEIFQTANNTSNGIVTASANVISIRRDLTPTLSANTDFYKNSSFYIRSGTGAGQLRTITEYIVTGNERRVLIDEGFNIVPDTTSRFEIGPRVFIDGNGTGSAGVGSATAIATVAQPGNEILSIEIIDPGKNYTYASALIQSNTGFIDSNTGLPIIAESATVRPIISPPGGHGSNPINELFAESIGISINIIGDENGKVPVQNDYRTLGIIKSPLIANTEVILDDSALIFADGDVVTQPITGVSAEVSNRQGNTLRLRNLNGQLITGHPIVSSSGSIQSVINTVDRTIDIIDQRVRFAVEITNLGPQGTGFIEDEYVVQEDTSGTGYVFSIDSNRIDLVGVRGVWNVSDDATGFIAEMTGTQSGAVAKITGKVEGDFTPNSGKILYIENVEPISRAIDQTERLKIVLKF